MRTYDGFGIDLASRLGLANHKRSGHDLAGPCIVCKSSDAFRLHQHTGVGHCYSCQGSWSPFQVAEVILRDREQAKRLFVELGVFEPLNNGNATNSVVDPIETIARQKGITPASLRAYGAVAVSPKEIKMPAYGPNGNPCTTFMMKMGGSKGLFEKDKKAGLFFPHVDGKVRLPRAGEVWHLVEGPKDAAALYGLDLLACGLNTCRLAPKFVRLFKGVQVILVPDRDRAGVEGGAFSSRVLRGVAKSVQIAVLPAEFTETDGADVRDVLRGPDGRNQVLQAIADAQPSENWETIDVEHDQVAFVEIPLSEGQPLRLEVAPAGRQPQRLVVAVRGETEYRDQLNTDSSSARDRFLKKLATKLGMEVDTFAPLVEGPLIKLAKESDENRAFAQEDSDDDPQSQATQAVELADDWDLWHNPAKEAYASFAFNGHTETWPIRSQTFRRYVAKQYFDAHGIAMNSEALSSAVNLFEAQALFDGPEQTVHVRLAELDGKIYLDLCDPTWQAVEISRDGWRVVPDSPVRFRRSRGMLPLPLPRRGGTVELLRPFLNVDDEDWRLILSWLVAALRPRGPYPVLALFAEQGSGKSTVARLLRGLVDPNSAPLRAEPKDGRDLMIAANNSWCLAYDNLSHLHPWLSDAMCRLSTGGGFTTRELYTDQEEIIFDAQRPVILTSIEEVATRSDLLDRCLIVWLPTIPKKRRRTEEAIFRDFRKVQPLILGALLGAVVVALQRIDTIQPPEVPRLADFAYWAMAAETAFGWPEGTFLKAYEGNCASANEVALEAAVVAGPLLGMLEVRGEWVGTSSELLKVLEERLGEQVKRLSGWPKNPRALSGHLKRLAPNLRQAGWTLDQDRKSSKRLWTIRRVEMTVPPNESAPASSFASSETTCETMPSDADGTILDDDDAHDTNDANAGPLPAGSFEF